MVTGNGMKARRFAQYALRDSHIIFASGVSRSTETNPEAFSKEEQELVTLLQKYPEKNLVYFSTASIYDPQMTTSVYVQHKQKMENLIQSRAQKYLIFRASQIVGISESPSSLINFLVNAIQTDTQFTLWENAARNFIDVDDLFFIIDHIITKKIFQNRIVNIANPYSTPVKTVVSIIETFFGKKGRYLSSPTGTSYEIPIEELKPIINEIGLKFDDNYTANLIEKYFRHRITRPKLISIVIPTYFAEKGIHEFYRRTKSVLDTLAPRYTHEFIFVNDGSRDLTLEKLIEIAKKDHSVKILDFARNFGNQLAITAGIDKAAGDVAVIIDDDLQDPPEVILNFIAKWEAGYDVVYGVRLKRRGVNPVFKLIAKLYYRLVSVLSEVKIPNDTGDFRLIDRVVIDTLRSMREESRYYRGMVAWTGYRQLGLNYDRDPRYAGTTTFTFTKYLKFGFTGITSFSDKPLHFASYFGLFITIVGFAFALWVSISKMLNPQISIPGWTSLSAIVIFFGGVQLISIGILGLYISKIFRQVKNRPLYITRKEYQYSPLENTSKISANIPR